MPDFPPYNCTGSEAQGDAYVYNADGEQVNVVQGSRCFLDWYCPAMGFTWEWRFGIDPDDPTTWPQPPEDPPIATTPA